jgi:hypothetical protein
VSWSSKRGRIITVASVSILVCVVIVIHYLGAGDREIDAALPLIANAQSWHVSHSMGPVHVEEDVVCPFDYDATSTIGQTTVRNVQVNNTAYMLNASGQWTSHPASSIGHCSYGPQIDRLGLAVELRIVRDRGILTRGGAKQVAGRSCRLWKLRLPGSSEPLPTLCVDKETHYPLELATSVETYQFTHWNEVAAIQPPQMNTSVTPATGSDVSTDTISAPVATQ